ncbi:PorP/SprF family type IX secretion system membrane protein [Mucilaginibacter agri]|uniref:Type IX secretion system membrane protein PorP/SprF n=1 Tax=Mucilaginibacter agri TaxID=2695265 RepID=A0A965ZLV7_9SPHI|nr:type IX secretion system membrane protein PorP/SprF [Mucilaginibacter agri]NCD72373.1 type IX secretion system membrane protein PorP/SprF [Mucilaginibacter agri]
MKSVKRLFIFIVIAFAGKSAMAQQDAMYTQYMFNTLAINPAYAGSRNVVSATALYRAQWVGMAGAPRTTTLSIDAPVESKQLGLGLQVFNDRIGIQNTSGFFTSYAYRIRMDKGTLAFGLQAGASQYNADFTSVDLGSDTNPDMAFANNVNKWLVNFGFGMYYNTDKFYIGLSAPQLLNNNFTNFKATGSNAFTGQAIHVFLAAGYVFPLGEDLHLKPSVLFKGVRGAPLEADINASLWFKDIISIGAQYRTEADIAGLVEIQITPQIRMGYSYDRATTSLVQYNSGSHEIMLRYEFGFSKSKVLSPRYF